MYESYVFYVKGMTCISCSSIIENAVASLESITIHQFSVDLTTADPKVITITTIKKPTENKVDVWNLIKGHIEDFGFTCMPLEYNPLDNQTQNLTETSSGAESTTYNQTNNPTETSLETESAAWRKAWSWVKNLVTSHWFLGATGCISGILFLILCLTMPAMPLAAMIAIGCFSVIFTLILGAHSFYDAWIKLIKARTLTMDTLFTISTISVLVVSVAAFFVPWLPMMFDAGLLIYGFRHLGIAIEDSIKEQISSVNFQDRAPKKVQIITTHGITTVNIQDVQPGSEILIYPGEIIPLDGTCLGEHEIYDTILTGEIVPSTYQKDNEVLAGMRVSEHSSSLRMRVKKNAEQSYLAVRDEGIKKSLIEKSPLEVQTSKLLTYFIPTIIVLAILSGILVGIFFPPALAIQCAASVLVSACPCTLGLIIPLAVKTGMNKGAEYGVEFKNPQALQNAKQINCVAFDLNGTLTKGKPKVSRFNSLSQEVNTETLLAICSALEQNSRHPHGQAILKYAEKNSMTELHADWLDETHNAGILGVIKNKKYMVGGKNLMTKYGISTQSIDENIQLLAGDNLVYIAQDSRLLGYFILHDPLREDARTTVEALINKGIKVKMITGTDRATAERYAKVLNITSIEANCVPTEKLNIINMMKKEGLIVAMVGDAANDADALAASDYGIAVTSKQSDEVTRQHASAIIHKGGLLPIANLFAISEQTVDNIGQNLTLSLGYNLIAILIAGGLLVALGFALNPGIGVALMTIQACLILLNVYRFKSQELPHFEEKELVEETPTHDLSTVELEKKHDYVETLSLGPTLKHCGDQPSYAGHPGLSAKI